MGTSGAKVRSAVGKVRGGVHVLHQKNTADQEIVRLPAPNKVVIPMQMHIGAPCVPIVNVGDTVSVGQCIGDTTAFVSAPIHASISGTVTAVGETTLANGAVTRAVTIESDGEMRLFDGIEPPTIDTREAFLSGQELLDIFILNG